MLQRVLEKATDADPPQWAAIVASTVFLLIIRHAILCGYNIILFERSSEYGR